MPVSLYWDEAGAASAPSRSCASAPISTRRATPSRTARRSGASRNGKSSTAPRPRDAICKMTLASDVRRISGSVKRGRER